ncbi:hypothetical protein RQP46_009687 [Phenoliferia psychrophenolica]
MSTSSAPITPFSVASLASLTPTEVQDRYHPFRTPSTQEPDWTSLLELDTVTSLSSALPSPIKLVVLYGSLRQRSFSRLTAFEAARILDRLGADVRVFDPSGLPMKDGTSEKHEKVLELRALSEWSDGQLWVSPEQHGTITAVMKNQVDWIPLSLGSVRPTQGRTLAVCQVNGGSQSFNTVNVLRQLGTQFDSSDRLIPSSNRDRLVDVCEELVKVTALLTPQRTLLDDRYSEREEKRVHGALRTQAETELARVAAEEEKVRLAAAAANGSMDQLDILLHIFDELVPGKSPNTAECLRRQNALASLAACCRAFNQLATPLLYNAPSLTTTRAARCFGRTYAWRSSPWARATGSSKLAPVCTPTKIFITQIDDADRSNRRHTSCKTCAGVGVPTSPILPKSLFAAIMSFPNLISLQLTNCSVPDVMFVDLFAPSGRLRHRIKTLLLQNICIDRNALLFTFANKTNRKDRCHFGFRPTGYSSWDEIVAWLEDEELREFDGDRRVLEDLVEDDEGYWEEWDEYPFTDYETFRRFEWGYKHRAVWKPARGPGISPDASFDRLRHLTIPFTLTTATNPARIGLDIFHNSAELFPLLSRLTFTAGSKREAVSSRHVGLMRRSVTRNFEDLEQEGAPGVLLPPANAASGQISWGPLDPVELKAFDNATVYYGPLLSRLDLSAVKIKVVR